MAKDVLPRYIRVLLEEAAHLNLERLFEHLRRKHGSLPSKMASRIKESLRRVDRIKFRDWAQEYLRATKEESEESYTERFIKNLEAEEERCNSMTIEEQADHIFEVNKKNLEW